APAAGTVERVYRRVGEVVGPGETVAALRPPSGVKLRFFAPQGALSTLPVGARIAWSCDGCKGPFAATVVHVATDPQFTPPVIYSREQRDALVFLVEARPEPGSPRLAEGQPVDIDLP
ncbi:MAG: HlyD family secretion protein, partial [Parvularculaceae bacterium]|nr:HlyD family secretion protein [Parvularculaceae bacterium]